MITTEQQTILKCWNIEDIAQWEPLQENVFHLTLGDGRHFVFKAIGPYKAEIIHRLHFEYDVLSHVEQRGIAVAVPLLSAAGTPYVAVDEQIYRLSHWLPNRPVEPQTSAERSQLYRNYGAAIARFHQALATYQDDQILQRTWQTNLEKRVFGEAIPVVLAHLEQAALPAMQAALAELEPTMHAAYANLPVQPIIWDCHPGNVAVDGLVVSGFIDCDHIAIAPRVMDLADFLVHLVKWDLADEAKTTTWLAHFAQLLVGYEDITPLAQHERMALFAAMVAVPLIFMDFFFQSGLPDLTKTELALFDWLVRHRGEITAELETA